MQGSSVSLGEGEQAELHVTKPAMRTSIHVDDSVLYYLIHFMFLLLP